MSKPLETLKKALESCIVHHRTVFNKDVSLQELDAMLSELLAEKRRDFLMGMLADHEAEDIIILRKLIHDRENVEPGQMVMTPQLKGAKVVTNRSKKKKRRGNKS